jgi:branched-chain amino acid transport system permease protein
MARIPASVQDGKIAPEGGAVSRHRLRLEAGFTAILTLIFFLYIGHDAYRQDLALLVVAYAFLALGMYVPLALCGCLSLAYNAYFAIGAYAVAILANVAPTALWAAIPIAIVISMAIAACLGYATRRLSGFHLAVATMMFGIAVHTWLVHAGSVTGGATGIGNIPRLTVLSWPLGRVELTGIGIAGVWLVATTIARLRRSLVGVAMRGQRDAVIAAEAAGVPTATMKILSLAIGAAIATLAGILFALMNQFVLPDSFSISVVFLVLFMPVLGGLATPWGSVLGALIVVAFTLGFDFFQGPGSLTFGVLTLIVLLMAPSGLLGWAAELFRMARRRRAAVKP